MISFNLFLYVTVQRGFTVMFSFMHIMYFDHIHPSITLYLPSPHLVLITSLQTVSPNIVTLEVRVLIYEFFLR
jgi:hypothetical protein